MRTRRRFRPSVEVMFARIVPGGTSINDPGAAGSSPATTPIVDTNDLTTAPNVNDANLQIIQPSTLANPTTTLC